MASGADGACEGRHLSDGPAPYGMAGDLTAAWGHNSTEEVNSGSVVDRQERHRSWSRRVSFALRSTR